MQTLPKCLLVLHEMVLKSLVYMLVLEDGLRQNVSVCFSADLSVDSQQFESYRKCTDYQKDLAACSYPGDDVQRRTDRREFPG